MKRQTGKALNHEQPASNHIKALNVSLLPADGAVPDWVELIPPGMEVIGLDGRAWINDQPQGVLNYFASRQGHNRDLPIDWEHSSELKAPHGDQAPAAAWCTELEVRDNGAIWAKVDWTPKGRESVANREYRYLSPVIVFEKASRRIVGISSVGLVNKPNLKLTALNREGDNTTQENNAMKKIYAKLGLAETASEDDAVLAINALQQNLATANNRAESPSLEKFVPRADYNQALDRANNAEQALATHKQAELETAINAEIDAALKAGKITPATRDYHVASCRQEGGLERFKDYVKAAPTLAADSGLDGKETPGATTTALNAEEAKVAAMFGNTTDDLQKYGK